MYSRNKNAYHVFDFDNFHEKGLSKLKAAFKRVGQEITGVTASNRPIKKDGLDIKKAELFFLNGQKASLLIGDQGDVVQTKINNQARPVSFKSLKDIASGLSDAMRKNQKVFDESLAKKMAKSQDGRTDVKPASRPQGSRIKEIDELIVEARADLEEAKQRLSDAKNNNISLKVDINKLKNKVVELNSKIAQLNEQLETVGAN